MTDPIKPPCKSCNGTGKRFAVFVTIPCPACEGARVRREGSGMGDLDLANPNSETWKAVAIGQGKIADRERSRAERAVEQRDLALAALDAADALADAVEDALAALDAADALADAVEERRKCDRLVRNRAETLPGDPRRPSWPEIIEQQRAADERLDGALADFRTALASLTREENDA